MCCSSGSTGRPSAMPSIWRSSTRWAARTRSWAARMSCAPVCCSATEVTSRRGRTWARSAPRGLRGAHRFDPFGVWGDPVPKPVVMAVSGIAFTLSIELALAADIVIAADDVRFRQLEIGRGIVPFGGATFRAPAQLGWGNAMRFLLTAEEFGAAEALRIGLVQELVAT